MTIRSGDIACRLRAVSSSDSPFSTELPFAAKESASAESHFSAVSKEKRVRVEASKKRFTTMRPRSAGTFLISRSPMGRMDSAVSKMSAISPAERSSVPSRSFEWRLVVMKDSKFQIPDSRSSLRGSDQTSRVAAPWNLERGICCSGGFLQDPNLVGAVGLLEHDLDHLALGRWHALADVVRLDGNLAVPPVDQHGETNGTRPAEVDQAVQCRADRAPCVEDVVAQDNRAAVQVEIDLGLAQQRLWSDEREIVAVERDVESADGKGLLHEIGQARGQPCRQRDSPRANTDQSQVRQVLVPLGDLVRHAVDHPPDPILIQDAGLLDQSFDQLAASLWAVFIPRQGRRERNLSSLRQPSRTLTCRSRKNRRPASLSSSSRAAVPMSRIMDPPRPTTIPFWPSLSTTIDAVTTVRSFSAFSFTDSITTAEAKGSSSRVRWRSFSRMTSAIHSVSGMEVRKSSG